MFASSRSLQSHYTTSRPHIVLFFFPGNFPNGAKIFFARYRLFVTTSLIDSFVLYPSLPPIFFHPTFNILRHYICNPDLTPCPSGSEYVRLCFVPRQATPYALQTSPAFTCTAGPAAHAGFGPTTSRSLPLQTNCNRSVHYVIGLPGRTPLGNYGPRTSTVGVVSDILLDAFQQ